MAVLLNDLASLSSVYHKPADTFVSRVRLAVQKAADLKQEHHFDEMEEVSKCVVQFGGALLVNLLSLATTRLTHCNVCLGPLAAWCIMAN